MVTNNAANNSTAATGKVLQGAGVGVASTYSTATYPSVTAGTGKILYDNGTNFVTSVPTFPASASATSRKMMVSDGTNWVASTETWAAPGTSGNVLTSDGTNWVSSAPSSGPITVTGTITSAQIKALNGTPLQVIASPGSFFAVSIISAVAKFNWGSGTVFVAGAAQTIQLYYATTTAIMTLLTNENIVANSNQISLYSALTPFVGALSTPGGKAVNIYNPVATEITGDAGNFNSITYKIVYQVI